MIKHVSDYGFFSEQFKAVVSSAKAGSKAANEVLLSLRSNMKPKTPHLSWLEGLTEHQVQALGARQRVEAKPILEARQNIKDLQDAKNEFGAELYQGKEWRDQVRDENIDKLGAVGVGVVSTGLLATAAVESPKWYPYLGDHVHKLQSGE
ncbi:hypothetical protein FRB94_006511 [Tulasnella sp. JGI-2019a]|nr:hypothetical protein FRB94_006511 [Tulasnella sp. JGI-2019a]KAG9035758.1 hypothetical protein FRB95_010526 [Tulasnella sp. JGI-2019a]